MFDFKSEFQQLIDTYPLKDDMIRLSLAQKLEASFFERLQANLLVALSEAERNKLFADPSMTAEEFFQELYALNNDDLHSVIEDTFAEFKQEFLSNL